MTTPSQQYVYVQNPPQGRTGGRTTASQTGGQGQGQAGPGSRQPQSQQAPTAPFMKGLPQPVRVFLGNRQTLFYAWIVAMILVGFDDWHSYQILPRPSRFWYTSLTYGLLGIAASVDMMVPICNALGVGYTITLLWQYYNGSGQFGKTST
jgi:hypothetical protein